MKDKLLNLFKSPQNDQNETSMRSLRGNKNIRENKDPTRPESPLGDKLTEGDMIAKPFLEFLERSLTLISLQCNDFSPLPMRLLKRKAFPTLQSQLPPKLSLQ